MGWEVHLEGDIRHIWPQGEEHDLGSLDCACKPSSTVHESGVIIVLHNSFDGREYIERLTSKDNISSN